MNRGPLSLCVIGAALPLVAGGARLVQASDPAASEQVHQMDLRLLKSEFRQEIDGLRRDMFLIATASGLTGAGVGVAVDRRRREKTQ